MNKTKADKIVDSIFLIVLALVVSGLIINILVSGNTTEAAEDPTTEPTVAETTESEHTEKERSAEESTEPIEVMQDFSLYDVPLDAELQLFIIDSAEANGIDPAIIFAMAFKESTYRVDAVGDGGNSYGLLQVQPRYHWERMKKYGCTEKEDLLDPFLNVTVAIDYLCELLNRYGSIEKALTAYNKGHYAGTVTEYAKTVMKIAKEL